MPIRWSASNDHADVPRVGRHGLCCERFAFALAWHKTEPRRTGGTSFMSDPMGRIVKIRNGLTPGEWAGSAAWRHHRRTQRRRLGMLAAPPGPLPPEEDPVFGFGTGVLAYTLGMRHASTPITSRRSTTRPAN